ncbi:hypothetical protein T439DRAFT_360963 [Meredithblackwellia eburnea MCA 4105]
MSLPYMSNNDGLGSPTRPPRTDSLPPSPARSTHRSNDDHWASSPAPSYSSHEISFQHSRHSDDNSEIKRQYQNHPQLTVFVPPKAAFVSSPPPSPLLASPHAAGFGDVDPKTGERSEKVKRNSEGEWRRFSMAAKLALGDGKKKGKGETPSPWLEKRKSKSKKWLILGWVMAVVLLCCLGGLIAWHFMRPRTITTPTVLNLGDFNGKHSSTITSAGAEATTMSTSSSSSSRSRARRHQMIKAAIAPKHA